MTTLYRIGRGDVKVIAPDLRQCIWIVGVRGWNASREREVGGIGKGDLCTRGKSDWFLAFRSVMLVFLPFSIVMCSLNGN